MFYPKYKKLMVDCRMIPQLHGPFIEIESSALFGKWRIVQNEFPISSMSDSQH